MTMCEQRPIATKQVFASLSVRPSARLLVRCSGRAFVKPSDCPYVHVRSAGRVDEAMHLFPELGYLVSYFHDPTGVHIATMISRMFSTGIEPNV